MRKIINSNSGIYLLLLKSISDFEIIIPRFGSVKFKKGYYYYTGSAQRNLLSRVERHLRKEKKLFWHIDYLLSSENIFINKVYIFKDVSKSGECELMQQMENSRLYSHIIDGFGSSDCKTCKSHLLFSNKEVNQILSIGRSRPSLFFSK